MTTRVTLHAETEPQARERFNSLQDWLEELSYRGHRGTRFLFGLGATANAAETIEDVRELENDGIQSTQGWNVQTSFKVVADDTELARDRYEGYRAWLRGVADRGHRGMQVVVGGTLGKADTVEYAFDTEVIPSLFDFFPHQQSWLDPTDRGQTTDQDVDAVFKRDAHDALTLRTDARIEAVEALEMVAELLPRVSEKPYIWKWIIFALHNALQAFMVLALQGTWYVRVLRKRDARQLLEAHEREAAKAVEDRHDQWMFEEVKLDSFLNLYKKVQDTQFMKQYMNSLVFVPAGSQTESVEQLNRLRNEFVHFVPMSRIHYIGDLPEMVNDCVAIISFLAFDSQNVHWGTKQQLEGQTKSLLQSMQDEIRKLLGAYANLKSSSGRSL